MRTRHCDVYVSCCACPCSWQGTLKWAIFEVENAGTHEAMILIDIRSEPKVRSCSRMFNKEFGSSHPGPADVSFFATGRLLRVLGCKSVKGRVTRVAYRMVSKMLTCLLAVFGPGSDKIEIKKVIACFSTSIDVEVPRILVYCKSGPRMAAVKFMSLQDDHTHKHDHYLAYFDFVEGFAAADLVTWMVNKNGFSQYDARRSQVEGRDMQTLVFREQMHTRVLLNTNESLNEEYKQRLSQDPVFMTHTASRNQSIRAISTRTICDSQAKANTILLSQKTAVSPRHSKAPKTSSYSLDGEGCMRLTVTRDLAHASEPQNIGPGMQKLFDGKRRGLGRRKEVEYFGTPPSGERLSRALALSDLGVRSPATICMIGIQLSLCALGTDSFQVAPGEQEARKVIQECMTNPNVRL